MPENQTNQKRQIAHKVRIKELINGKYVKEEGWQPNYITTNDGKQISRVNLIGTVVSIPVEQDMNYQSIVLDDGTGRIYARSFEQNKIFDNIQIGDVVLLIGRPREYGNEIYLLPEILKKIQDKGWIKVREIELKKKKNIIQETQKEKPIEESKEEIIEEIQESTSDKIIRIVKENDKGDGVDFEEVLKEINDEKSVNELLKKGELFEIRPGRLKVLE
jgi:RPA family protein